MANPNNEISLKLLINKNTKTVLFAEASKDFIDFLFTVLSLPAAAITTLLLSSGESVGALGSLYDGLATLSHTYIQPNVDRNSILNPTLAGISISPSKLFASSLANFKPKKKRKRIMESIFICSSLKRDPNQFCYEPTDYSCCKKMIASNSTSVVCPSCNRCTKIEVPFVEAFPVEECEEEVEQGVVRGVVTYMVMDDLQVKPMSAISSISLLSKFNVKDVSCVEERIVSLGTDQGLKLLKALLMTKSVLTNVFLGDEKTA